LPARGQGGARLTGWGMADGVGRAASGGEGQCLRSGGGLGWQTKPAGEYENGYENGSRVVSPAPCCCFWPKPSGKRMDRGRPMTGRCRGANVLRRAGSDVMLSSELAVVGRQARGCCQTHWLVLSGLLHLLSGGAPYLGVSVNMTSRLGPWAAICRPHVVTFYWKCIGPLGVTVKYGSTTERFQQPEFDSLAPRNVASRTKSVAEQIGLTY
jgi:hypothetical protein